MFTAWYHLCEKPQPRSVESHQLPLQSWGPQPDADMLFTPLHAPLRDRTTATRTHKHTHNSSSATYRHMHVYTVCLHMQDKAHMV